MFSSLHSRVRTPFGLVLIVYYYILVYRFADWCNSNIIGSCPVNIGANPMSVHTIIQYKKPYELFIIYILYIRVIA